MNCGDIPLHRPQKLTLYVGLVSPINRSLKWPLIIGGFTNLPQLPQWIPTSSTLSHQFQRPTTRICLRKPAKLELLFPRDFPVVEPSQVDFQVKSNQNIPPFFVELTSQVILLGKHPSQQSALKWRLIGINIY